MTATTSAATEATIKHRLQHSGASESLAGAIADAAVKCGLHTGNIIYDDIAGQMIQLNTDDGTVPDAMHERLTGMGFEVMDDWSHDSDEGKSGCKYIDTKY